MTSIKRVTIPLLVIILTSFLLISCDKNKNKVMETDIVSIDEAIKDEEEVNEGENNKEETNKEEINKEDVSSTPLMIRDISSMELVKEINIGWSLGNTLDATGSGALLSTEMSWGNPNTKEETFIKLKESGFDIVRIPVSWGDHLGPEPDYIIHPMWLDRINEVVDYAIDNDLYVILNLHHEEWHYPSYDNLEKANTILTSVWTQLAQRFKDYDEHLIFEGMNEPRLKGTPLEWNGGNAEARDVINQLNKSFIDTIRNEDGNNPYRHLMIPTYAASSDPKTWKDFEIPDDDKVIVSIHAYTPYNFALNINGTSQWSKDNPSDTVDIDNLINNLYNSFISKGYPVIIGEFGAMNKDNLEARTMWVNYYIKKAAEKDIPCIWWDNGAITGEGELFGLLDRRKGVWQFPEIIDAMMSALE